MNKENDTRQEEIVSCKVCLKEIPISEAKSGEATDYVVHYCGLDCYEKWNAQSKEEES